MKKIFIILLAIAMILFVDVTRKEKDSIIIYSSMEQYRGEDLQNQLNEKFPDMNIMVMYVPTAKAAAKISVEKSGTDADIVVGLESSYMEKIKDTLIDLEDYPSLNFVEGLTLKDNGYKYFTWERFGGSFVINKEVIDKKGLEIPKTYDDLLKPEYKDLIAMPDPKSSGTGFFFYKNLVNTRGEDGALAYFDELEKNIKQFSESGSGPMKLLIQGEIAVGLGMTFQAINEINDGSPFEIIYPPEGSPYSITGAGITVGREDNENIREIFDFIMTDFFIYDKENYSPEVVLTDQVNKIPNYPQNIQYADMSGIEDIQEKERLLSIWKY